MAKQSQEGIAFFAIRLEVWTIGDSDPAVRFNVIEEPSEWKAKAACLSAELSERDRRREEFWTRLRDRIETRETPLRSRKPHPKLFYSNPIGSGGFHMSFVTDPSEKQLTVEVIIEDDTEAFRELEAQQEAIESEIGQSLIWIEPTERRTGNMRSRIVASTAGTLENREQWERYLEWSLGTGEQFYTVFSPRIQ